MLREVRRKDSYRYNLSKDLDSIYLTNSVTNFHKKQKQIQVTL
ncbi:hypothetical protein AT1219_80028 [Vibrio alginolyticus]